MKTWHLVVFIVIAYVIGSMFPAPVNFVRSKVGV